MENSISRRIWIASASAGVSLISSQAVSADTPVVSDTFPTQPPEMVKEMVTVSHGNAKRVRELVEAHPSLAKACWDWGFGDWEAAVDAASHVGNREIAEYLIEKGARPTLFTAAMLGQLEIVKACIAARPGVQTNPGPHGISLLAHAKNGGALAKPVYDYLDSLGDAGSPPAKLLTDDELNALKGTYSFGPRPIDRIEIAGERGQITFTRTGTTTRGLVHLGDYNFHPQGADEVRVIFNQDQLTVHDPQPVLVAVRSR